tara:strand:- start:6668 stop:6844 length:177 start_codon:yes stop_codon:yes gene_type:complete
MGWFKKAVFGMCFMLFIFIAIIFLEAAGANPFDSGFITVGGLMLLLGMGIFETNLVTL